MEEYWKKRLPILCGALGGAMLAGVVPACAGLRLAGGEDKTIIVQNPPAEQPGTPPAAPSTEL